MAITRRSKRTTSSGTFLGNYGGSNALPGVGHRQLENQQEQDIENILDVVGETGDTLGAHPAAHEPRIAALESNHSVGGNRLNIVQDTSIGSLPLDDASITGLSVVISTGSPTGDGVWNVAGVLNISGLSIPAGAAIFGAEIWCHAAGNLSGTGYARLAVMTLSNTSLTFNGQVAGNGSAANNMLNTHNSRLEGRIRYILP